jgi:hypothetical protein
MPAPVIAINSSNVGTWTNPTTTPATWYLFPVFADGTEAPDSASYSFQINGSLSSYDFTTTAIPAGYSIKMFGIDNSSNVIIAPSVSSDPLHFL